MPLFETKFIISTINVDNSVEILRLAESTLGIAASSHHRLFFRQFH